MNLVHDGIISATACFALQEILTKSDKIVRLWTLLNTLKLRKAEEARRL